MKTQLISALLAYLPTNVTQSNFEQRHVAFFPKSYQLWAIGNLEAIRGALRIALFFLCFAGLPLFGSSQVMEKNSFLTNGCIELNRCFDSKKVLVRIEADSIFVGLNSFSYQEVKRVVVGVETAVYWKSETFEGVYSFDSDGINSLLVYSGRKKEKLSLYSINYVDDKAEFLNNR